MPEKIAQISRIKSPELAAASVLILEPFLSGFHVAHQFAIAVHDFFEESLSALHCRLSGSVRPCRLITLTN